MQSLGVFNTETAFTEEIDIASLLDISGNFVSILSVDISDGGEVLAVLRNSVNPPNGDHQDTYVFRFKRATRSQVGRPAPRLCYRYATIPTIQTLVFCRLASTAGAT